MTAMPPRTGCAPAAVGAAVGAVVGAGALVGSGAFVAAGAAVATGADVGATTGAVVGAGALVGSTVGDAQPTVISAKAANKMNRLIERDMYPPFRFSDREIRLPVRSLSLTHDRHFE